MNISERLPMKITESNSKRLKQKQVTLSYLNGHVTPRVKCNRIKEISKFGFRIVDGKKRDQSRCNKCR